MSNYYWWIWPSWSRRVILVPQARKWNPPVSIGNTYDSHRHFSIEFTIIKQFCLLHYRFSKLNSMLSIIRPCNLKFPLNLTRIFIQYSSINFTIHIIKYNHVKWQDIFKKRYSIFRVNKFIPLPLILNYTNCATSHWIYTSSQFVNKSTMSSILYSTQAKMNNYKNLLI